MIILRQGSQTPLAIKQGEAHDSIRGPILCNVHLTRNCFCSVAPLALQGQWQHPLQGVRSETGLNLQLLQFFYFYL